MLDTLSFPIYSTMNHARTPTHSIAVYWFAETRSIHDHVSGMADDGIRFEGPIDIQDSFVAEVSLMDPCQIIILEIPDTEATSWKANKQLDYVTSLIRQAFQYRTFPTILCIGNRIPAERVVEWMQLGVYSYVEASGSVSDIFKMLQDAKNHATSILNKYLRFQKLQKLFDSFAPEEISIMEMIFEGLPNKTIASRLRLSQRTIEGRRQRVFANLESKSLSVVVQTICEWHQLKKEFCSDRSL